MTQGQEIEKEVNDGHMTSMFTLYINTIMIFVTSIFITRDVKKIRTRSYPRKKPATGRKQILKMDTRYPWIRVFLRPAC